MAAPRWAGWLGGLTLAFDQATKHLAEALLVMHKPVPVLPSFNLTLIYNTGGPFGSLADAGGWQRWFFLSLGIVISVGLIIWFRQLKPDDRRLSAALALILAGGVGNLIDRILLGHVIDFIQLYYGHRSFPVFNIADSAISIGAALLVLDILLSKPAEPLKNPADHP